MAASEGKIKLASLGQLTHNPIRSTMDRLSADANPEKEVCRAFSFLIFYFPVNALCESFRVAAPHPVPRPPLKWRGDGRVVGLNGLWWPGTPTGSRQRQHSFYFI